MLWKQPALEEGEIPWLDLDSVIWEELPHPLFFVNCWPLLSKNLLGVLFPLSSLVTYEVSALGE